MLHNIVEFYVRLILDKFSLLKYYYEHITQNNNLLQGPGRRYLPVCGEVVWFPRLGSGTRGPVDWQK